MKLVFTISALFLTSYCFSQRKNVFNKHVGDTTNKVSFITRFYMKDLDKDDAAILNGYVVAMGYERAKKLNGKKIRITGKVIVINDSSNNSPNQPVQQQRQGLYKYIASPKIEIIK